MPRTAVAAASVVAAEAGSSAADLGGNAVDTAISAMVASMSTELGIVSPGGGAFITIWAPSGEPLVIDAYAEMPGRGLSNNAPRSTARVHMDYGGSMETIVGWASVAIPGAFAGFEAASEQFGLLPWSDLLAPAIAALRRGFPATSASAYYLGYAHDVIYGWNSETRPMYHRSDGSPLQAGDMVSNSQLADCLGTIAENGAAALYTGDLGEALVTASNESGGLLTRQDLGSYRPIVRKASRVTLREWDIATNAPPAVGGMTLSALLTLIDRLGMDGWSASDVATYADAQAAVFTFRQLALDGDADRTDAFARLMDLADSGDIQSMHHSPSTVHVSAVDETGLACAITSSAGYGSGATIPGTGFGLNNSLGELELTTEGLHVLAPGTRLLSNMAPTIARSSSGQIMAIGSPGADRITSAIASVLYNYIVCGMDLANAVAHPRIHAETVDGAVTLVVEPGIDTALVDNVTIRTIPALSMYLGGVQVTQLEEDGHLTGVSDPRREGAVRIGGRGD